jgi:hypothetical protein
MGSANQLGNYCRVKVLHFQQHTFDELMGAVSWVETLFHLRAN